MARRRKQTPSEDELRTKEADLRRQEETEARRHEAASREAAQAAAREAQALDRQEEGPFEAEQARGHVHQSDPFEPHEKEALDDAAARRLPEEEAGA